MAAANLTSKTDFPRQGFNINVIKVTKVTQNDWLSLTKYKGVIPLSGINCTATTNSETSTVESVIYGTMLVNGAVAGTTATSIIVDGADATRITPYYALTTQGEIIEVLSESDAAAASGTLTVKRARFGTTAVALADNDVIFVLNQLKLSGSGTGYTFLPVIVLPNDGAVPLFSAAVDA